VKRTFLVLIGLFVLLAAPRVLHAEEKKVDFSGDFRGRWEGFRYSEDETGSKKNSRGRLRYRFRLNIAATINEHFKAAARLTTGDIDNRSGNQTLGSPVDFGSNEFDLRRAYVIIYPFSNGVLPGERKGKWEFHMGRVPNPLIWKHSPDKMLWDSDIALSGASTLFEIMAGTTVGIFANAGYYVVEESGSGKDPYMLPAQVGVVAEGEKVNAGIRGTYYYFDKLDADFVRRGVDGFEGVTSSGGNIIDGLTGDARGGTLNVAEAQAFVTLVASESWPVTAFGGASNNTSASASDSVSGVDKEANAFNVGLETGSRKKIVRVGVGYVHIEANAFPSQFIDSDYLDGFTNRKGFIIYVSRQLMANTDIGATVLSSDAINNDLPNSVGGSERTRIQVDLSVKF